MFGVPQSWILQPLKVQKFEGLVYTQKNVILVSSLWTKPIEHR